MNEQGEQESKRRKTKKDEFSSWFPAVDKGGL